ncbi:MAG: glycosyltransferase family 2 protein [Bryobacterales bacterium]|nr:glycosyltransferase family 2 protein [Bryobacterales bacterium]
MTVSAVIPTWNRRALLERILEDLRAQTLPPSEVIVVDNGSTDGSAEAAGKAGARVIRLEANRGFSHAVNRGITASAGEWVAILNNDVRLAPDWIERLLPTADSECWFVSGKLMRAGGSGILDGSFDLLCRGACAWRAGNNRPDGPVWNTPRKVFFVPFTAAIFRRTLFDRIGLLDEEFESYLEDVEFGLRCALAGCSGMYQPSAVAHHLGSATLGSWNPETVRRVSRNQMLIVAKHYPRDWVRRYGWEVLVGQLLWGAVAVRHRAGWAWIRGKREGIGKVRTRRRQQDDRLRGILAACEAEIRAMQEAAGYDLFWRLYFALT